MSEAITASAMEDGRVISISGDSIASATVVLKGGDWGDLPLWTITEAVKKGATPAWSIDVHAADADEAKATAAAEISAPRSDPWPPPRSSIEEALASLPADQPLTPAQLLQALGQ